MCFFRKRKNKQKAQEQNETPAAVKNEQSARIDDQPIVLQQDLSQDPLRPGGPFLIQMFMKQSCALPSKERVAEVTSAHLGEVEVYFYKEDNAGIAAKDFATESEGKMVPSMLGMFSYEKPADFSLDVLTTSQFWDNRGGESIIAECSHIVGASVMMCLIDDPKKKAALLTGYTLALMELFPDCEAVLFQSSGKLLTREQILERKDDPYLFIYIGVNARFFNIQDTEDMMVDTLGMSTLFLPDVQMHFHGADHNAVINHAYNIAIYLFENGDVIDDGETVDGLNVDMKLDRNVQWRCQHEDALIQPVRLVLDVNMGEYASGKRE